MKNLFVFLLLYFTLWSSSVLAEGGGFNVNYRDINIRVEFNDNIKNDHVSGMTYIREPSGLFYDVIYLIQTNRQFLEHIKQDVFVDADNLNNSLSIYLKYEPKGYILDESNVMHFEKTKLISGICRSLQLLNCVIDGNNKGTYLFYNKVDMSSDDADLVEFGCFPCANKKNYTLTHIGSNLEDSKNSANCNKIEINRNTIGKYFQKL